MSSASPLQADELKQATSLRGDDALIHSCLCILLNLVDESPCEQDVVLAGANWYRLHCWHGSVRPSRFAI